jgi:hypothetical protein
MYIVNTSQANMFERREADISNRLLISEQLLCSIQNWPVTEKLLGIMEFTKQMCAFGRLLKIGC